MSLTVENPQSLEAAAAAISQQGENQPAQAEGNQRPTNEGSLTTDQLQTQLLGGGEEPTEEPTEVPEDSATAEEPVETEEFDPEAILSTLTEEQRRALAIAQGGRLGKDLGELRAKNRELENSLQQELTKSDGLRASVTNNPYDSIGTREELQTTFDQAAQMIRDGELALMKHGTASSEDVVMTLGNRDLTKDEVVEAVYNAKLAQESYLPARLDTIQKTEKVQAERSQWDKQAEAQYPWLADPQNEVAKLVTASIAETENQIKAGIVPPRIKAIFAAAAQTAYADQLKPAGEAPPPAKPTVQPKIPIAPSGAVAQSGQPGTGKKKQVQLAASAFEESGTEKDLARLFLAKS